MKAILGILSLFILPGTVVACWEGIKAISADQHLWLPILTGIIIGILVYILALKNWYWLLVWEHEFTHAVAAWMFFRRVEEFRVTERGGFIRHSGGPGGELGDHMIGMAPYILPTFSLLSVCIKPLLPYSWFPYVNAFIGFTLSFHTITTFDETLRAWHKEFFKSGGIGEYVQSDIGRRGFFFAAVFIPGMTLFLHALVFWMLKYRYAGFLPCVNKVFYTSLAFYAPLYFFLKSWLHKLMHALMPANLRR